MRIFKISKKDNEGEVLKTLEGFLSDTKKDWNYILPAELSKKGPEKFFILDVRRPEDFKKGHIKGAVNIFWLDIMKKLDKLPKGQKIVVVCYVGHTASQVMLMLRLLGYDAVALKFGMGISPTEGVPVAGWVDYGFEVVK